VIVLLDIYGTEKGAPINKERDENKKEAAKKVQGKRERERERKEDKSSTTEESERNGGTSLFCN
jgi:hypothetical protein